MSEYAKVKVGKLVLKGESTSSSSSKRKHKKHKRDKADKTDETSNSDKPSTSGAKRSRRSAAVDEDAIAHGGWWAAASFAEITGSVALQFGARTYITALDNGLFALGAPHAVGEPPAPEEIFTAMPVNETRIALKSGYGKYLSVDRNGMVTGRSDAVGATEQFEPVFEAGRLALQSAANSCFVAVDPEDDALVALRKTAGAAEVLTVRSAAVRPETGAKDDVPTEEKGDLSQVEINYIKKFQKFQDKKLRISAEDKVHLEKAKIEGVLHEKLLDRRTKMKADRYCK